MKLADFMKENSRACSFDDDIILEYEMLLQGKFRRIPKGTWDGPKAKENARLILRHVFENKADITFDDLKRPFGREFKNKWRLNGLLSRVYNNSIQDAILDVYGEWIKPWEFHNAKRYLTSMEGIEKWLEDFSREHFHFESKEDVRSFFHSNTLASHIKVKKFFGHSPYEAYRYFYEKGLIAIELAPDDFFMDWREEDTVNSFLASLVQKHGLDTKEAFIRYASGPALKKELKGLYTRLNNSPWQVYEYMKDKNIIPYTILPFELKVSPMGYYQDDKNKELALRWLIYDKLQVSSKEEYLEKVKRESIDTYLRGLRVQMKMQEIHEFVQNRGIIPWTILPWEVALRPKDLWDDEPMRKKAIDWFFDTYLALPPHQIHADSFTRQDIIKARLLKLYRNYYTDVYENPKEMWVRDYWKGKEKANAKTHDLETSGENKEEWTILSESGLSPEDIAEVYNTSADFVRKVINR